MAERIDIIVKRVNDFYNDRIDGNKLAETLAFIFCFAFIAFMMFRLNRPTPWVVDDLLKQQAARNIHNFDQLYVLAHNFYLHWGGRVWGEINAQLFLMIPKHIFDYINTVGYMVLLLLIQWNILGKLKLKPGLLLFIHFSLLLCLPAFGQDVLWISGTANYMWASLVPLFFFGFWRMYQVTPRSIFNHPVALCIFFILGIFAGWENENVSVALIVMAIGYMLMYRTELGKIPRFTYAGIVGLILGSLALWLAPGNFVRFTSEGHSRSIFHFCRMIVENSLDLFRPSAGLALIIVFVVFFLGVKNIKRGTALNFFVGAFVSAIAFSVIGEIHSRVYFGPIAFLIVAAGILYSQWNFTLRIREIRCLVAVLLLLGSVGFYTDARGAIKDYAFRWNDNIRIIQMEKQKGNMDVFVNPITPRNKFCATYQLDDIKPQSQNKHWLNTGVARFFGIHTIQSVRIEDKK